MVKMILMVSVREFEVSKLELKGGLRRRKNCLEATLNFTVIMQNNILFQVRGKKNKRLLQVLNKTCYLEREMSFFATNI